MNLGNQNSKYSWRIRDLENPQTGTQFANSVLMYKMAIVVKIQTRVLYNDFSHIITDLPLKCYQPERESHDWQAQEISAFFL